MKGVDGVKKNKWPLYAYKTTVRDLDPAVMSTTVDSTDLKDRKAFGEESFKFSLNLKGRKWVRLEMWDAVSNGAFPQIVWLK